MTKGLCIDLAGKTAIVTGSTDGIGFATARSLHDAGASVIINGRNAEKVADAVKRIGASCRGVVADLATGSGCDRLIAEAGDADILVNNAGLFEPIDFFAADDAVWERHWQLNVMAGVRLARHYLPLMERSGWGRVIYLGSESAFNIPADMIHYGVSKTADVALARGLAKRMAGTNVTVNSVLPGPTLSHGVKAMLTKGGADSQEEAVLAAKTFVLQHRSSSIIQRAATVEEVAYMIVYVASPLASATTGAALRVDGGVIDTLM
jgi:NAD(P)-dependent dehydrogenase (short-subunit alcohol dehydrogenase family)